MDKEKNDVREVKIDDLFPFKCCSHQIYEEERLGQLMDSIEKSGQMYPVVVRSFCDEECGKYEIISGHNRARAMKELGFDTILAEVWDDLANHDALKLFYEIKLSKQPFSGWSYLQKIESVRYYNGIIKECSRQGKRTDLEEKNADRKKDGELVKSRQKLEEKSEQNTESRQKLEEKKKRMTTRDVIARQLGISTATLSKYRSIIKLPDDIADHIGRLLDRKMITFKAVCKISQSGISKLDIRTLLRCIEESPDMKVDMNKLEILLCDRKRKEGAMHPVYDDKFKQVLVPKN